jgi:hypothetical protein
MDEPLPQLRKLSAHPDVDMIAQQSARRIEISQRNLASKLRGHGTDLHLRDGAEAMIIGMIGLLQFLATQDARFQHVGIVQFDPAASPGRSELNLSDRSHRHAALGVCKNRFQVSIVVRYPLFGNILKLFFDRLGQKWTWRERHSMSVLRDLLLGPAVFVPITGIAFRAPYPLLVITSMLAGTCQEEPVERFHETDQFKLEDLIPA